MPRQEKFTTTGLLLWAVFFAVQLPAMGRAMEPVEGRWKTILGSVQLEYRHGLYVARMLEDNPQCDLEICAEVFRGRLDEDGVFVGMSRACLSPECRAEDRQWVFAMGLLSDNDNRLDIVGLAPRRGCKKRDFERHAVNIRQSLENIDCQKRRLERRLSVLRKRVRDAKVFSDFEQIQKELDALFRQYPDEPELMDVQARLYLAEGSQASMDKAAEIFELAKSIQPGARGGCGLAMLNAKAKNIAEGVRHLRECAEGGYLTCEDISDEVYEPLRSHREYREIRSMLECEDIN